MDENWLIGAVIPGLVGAAMFDALSWLLQHYVGIRAPNWSILGRWLLAPFKLAGQPAPQPGQFSLRERLLGQAAHYSTAIVFALGLILLMGSSWLERPTLLPAVLFGIATTVLAWFVIMPALGAGIAASATPFPTRIRLASLTSHAVMGAGFYIGTLLNQVVGVN